MILVSRYVVILVFQILQFQKFYQGKGIVVTSILRKVHDRVRELCKNNKFDFISHQQITRDLLYHHGVHLTDLSTEILADNIVDYINNFIL